MTALTTIATVLAAAWAGVVATAAAGSTRRAGGRTARRLPPATARPELPGPGATRHRPSRVDGGAIGALGAWVRGAAGLARPAAHSPTLGPASRSGAGTAARRPGPTRHDADHHTRPLPTSDPDPHARPRPRPRRNDAGRPTDRPESPGIANPHPVRPAWSTAGPHADGRGTPPASPRRLPARAGPHTGRHRVSGASTPARPPPEVRADRRVGWALVAGGVLVLVAPPLAPVPLLCALVSPVMAARAAQRRWEAALVDQVPDLVDLLALTTAAGLPVGVALGAIGDRPGGPAAVAIARARAHVERGGSTAGALDHLVALGPPARPLVDALAQHDRYGTPLLPALQRVAIETRARRRRRAEEAARRLPVTLLFPLVLTTLPAFVLLTVVPLLAGSLGALGT